MKIKTVLYSESREFVSYEGLKLWKKYETVVELMDGESEDEAAKLANGKVKEWLRGDLIPVSSSLMQAEGITFNHVGHDFEGNQDKMKEAIYTCGSIKELNLYDRIIEREKDETKKRELWLAYDKRFSELSNQK